MKKFKLQAVKSEVKDAKGSTKEIISGKESKVTKADDKRKAEMEKEMALVAAKISEAGENIKQTEKMLDIDLFLKKQKEKRLEYAQKLNQDYEHQKQQRQDKLYRTSSRQPSQKLSAAPSKSELPMSVFSALAQLKQVTTDQPTILDDHYHKIEELLQQKELITNIRVQEEKEELQSRRGWKRIKEVSNNCSEINYFPVSIKEGQLQPSDDGESLISALTLIPPNLSQQLYQQWEGPEKQPYFLCKFFPGGERKSILTDSYIKVQEYTHKYVNVGSRCKDNITYWPTVIEKAYQRLYLGQKLEGLSDTIHNLYGIDPQFIPISSKLTIKENLAKILASLLPKTMIGFLDQRAPTYQRIFPLLQIVFPIKKEKKEKKANKSSIDSPEETLFHISNPYAGIVLKSSFVNKFTLNELFEKFTRIVVLRDYPIKWVANRIVVEFLSNGPPSFTGSDWTKNNQYSFTLTREVQARLFLRRKWGTRQQEGDRTDPKSDTNAYGFLLFKSVEGQTEVSCMKLEGLLAKCRSSDEGCPNWCGKLEKGTYVLVPFSHFVSQSMTQVFNLDIYLDRDECFSLNKAKLNDYYYDTTQIKDQKVLQKLQSKVRFEKPRLQKLIIPKLFSTGKSSIAVQVQQLGLTINKEVNAEDYYLPGRLRSLLVNGQQKQEKKERPAAKSAQTEEIERYEKAEALQILLGYDALMGEDLNQGELLNIVEETVDIVDLANYGLGEEGLLALIEPLMAMPRIKSIDLSGNNLNDSAVTYLCYYLQKNNRQELESLILSDNKGIGKQGCKALKGLTFICKHLQVTGIKI